MSHHINGHRSGFANSLHSFVMILLVHLHGHRSGFANSLHGSGIGAVVLASAPAALYGMPPKVRDPGKALARTKIILAYYRRWVSVSGNVGVAVSFGLDLSGTELF